MKGAQHALSNQALLLLFALTSPSLVQASSPIEGRVMRVVDGDTLEVSVDGARKAVDLAEIDCPEEDQPFGEEARRATVELALYEEVRVTLTETSPPGQSWARVYLPDGRELNAELVSRGLAWWRSEVSEDLELAALEKEARLGRVGLWSASDPVAPWQWRREAFRRSLQEVERAEPAPAPRRDCIPRSRCCKVCSKGKACGSSFISRSYTCRKGRGCACNRSEVC